MVSRGGVSVSVERLAEPSRRTSCEEGRFQSKLPGFEREDVRLGVINW